MIGRVYSAVFSAVAVTAQQDLFEINVASTKMVEILELHLSQATEIADAQEEMLAILIKTGATTSGSGGSGPTAVPRAIGAAAFAGTVEVNNTTKANTGTIVTHEAHNWNVRVPWQRVWLPETTIVLTPSARLTIELATTPADSITMSGTIIFSEVG